MSVSREEWYGGAEQRTLSGDLTVSFKLARLWDITPDTSGRTVTLPDARRHRTGGTWAIVNRGADSIDVDDAGGSLVATLADDQGVILGLLDNSTAAGVWTAMVRSVGVVDNPALGVLGYVFGGNYAATNDDEKDVREWNPQLDTWTSKTASTSRHKRGVGLVIGASGYICTGESSSATDDHEQYDPDTWTTRALYPINSMRGSGCALNDGTDTFGYVFDGWSGSDAARKYAPPATDSWSSVTSQPDGTDHATSATIDSNGYIVGGDLHSGGGLSTGRTLAYSPTGDNYSTETEIPHGRGFCSLTALGSSGYIFGGATSDSTSQATCWDESNTYATSTNTWSLGTDYPLGRVCEAAAVVLDSKHYICGGDNFTTATPGGVLEDGVQEYDSSLDAYATQTDMPEAREEIHNQGLSIQA